MDAVTEQLTHQPTLPTRTRKRMRENPLATWELRIGNLRVYYNVPEELEPVVHIQAVGVKQRDRVYINKKESEL